MVVEAVEAVFRSLSRSGYSNSVTGLHSAAAYSMITGAARYETCQLYTQALERNEDMVV